MLVERFRLAFEKYFVKTFVVLKEYFYTLNLEYNKKLGLFIGFQKYFKSPMTYKKHQLKFWSSLPV